MGAPGCAGLTGSGPSDIILPGFYAGPGLLRRGGWKGAGCMLSYKNKITIQDVADMAGVSKTTVSRYINGKYEYMSEETRQRIGQIIEKTGYMPSTSAQSLKSNRTGLIGLLIADIGNPFSTALLTSITDSLHQIG